MTNQHPDLKYAAWTMVPEHVRQPLRDYLERSRPVGDFLTAVLSNDLGEAARRADAVNRVYLADIALFLTYHAPSAAWGSPEKVAAWLAAGEDGGS